jgi:hypothetical protein
MVNGYMGRGYNLNSEPGIQKPSITVQWSEELQFMASDFARWYNKTQLPKAFLEVY